MFLPRFSEIHCDRLVRAYKPNVPPDCGGQWAWLLTLGACGEGSMQHASAVLIDYQTGNVIDMETRGLL